MENLKLGLFDIAGHIVPGIVLMFSITLPFNYAVHDFNLMYQIICDLSSSYISIYLFNSYIVSLLFHQIAYWSYLGFCELCKLLSVLDPEFEYKLDDKEYAKKLVSVRKDNPENMTYINAYAETTSICCAAIFLPACRRLSGTSRSDRSLCSDRCRPLWRRDFSRIPDIRPGSESCRECR